MNAKELALAALNATSNLADIYTYLMSIGVSFSSIADVMTSKNFNFIAQMMEDDAFDADWKPVRLKDAINIYLNGTFLAKGEALWSVVAEENDKTNPPTNTDWVGKLESSSIEKLQTYLKNVESRLAKEKGVEIGDYDYGLDGYYEDDYADYLNVDPNERHDERTYNAAYKPTTDELRACKQSLEMMILSKEYRAKQDSASIEKSDTQIKKILDVLPDISAYEIVGGIAGINKGLKTKPYDQYKWKNRIENFYKNTKIGDTFSLLRYINDAPYRANVDEELGTNPMKNPLVAVFNVPHYRRMLKGWAINEESSRLCSTKIKVVDETIKTFKDRKINVDESAFRAIQQCAEEAIIVKWLQEKKINIILSNTSKKYKGNKLSDQVQDTRERFITLDSVSDIATFKHFMENEVIEELKRMYPNNAFINALTTSASNVGGVISMAMHFTFSISDVDKSSFLQMQYKKVVDDFKKIMNERLNGANSHISIGDAFYLYNLVVNKDRPGPRTMTRLFEVMVTNGNDNSLCLDFQKYTIDFDKNLDRYNEFTASNGFINDCINYNEILHGSGSTFDNPDFTFKLPKYFGEYKYPQRMLSKESNNRLLFYQQEDTPIKITLAETLTKFCEAMGIEAGNEEGIFTLYNNQDVDDAKSSEEQLDGIQKLFHDHPSDYKKARAFILGGKIYINAENADVTDPIHEWMHLVLAGFKYSKPMEYDAMMQTISDGLKNNNAWLNTIAKSYPDAVGSDLCEEIFVNLCQMYVRDTYFTNGDLLTQFMKQLGEANAEDPAGFMAKIFESIFKEPVTGSDIASTVMRKFFSNMEAGNINPAEDVMRLQLLSTYNNQIASLKKMLASNGPKNSNDFGGEESYLTMECEN